MIPFYNNDVYIYYFQKKGCLQLPNLRKFDFWLPVLGLLVVLLPFLLRHPFPYAFESALHIRTSIGFALAFADDPGYPDWFATPYDGQGTPLFRFLAPIPYFVAMIFQFFGIPAYLAVKLSFITFFLIGSIAIYRLTISETQKQSNMAFFLIVSNPYIVVFLHFAFQFQNLCAYFLFPWIILGCKNIADKKKTGWHILSITLGIMAFTHLQTTLLAFYAAVIFGAIISFKEQSERWRPLSLICLAAVFAFMFAAPYILPAMGTKSETHFGAFDMKNLAPGNQFTPFLDNPLHIENSMELPVYKGFGLIFSYLGINAASEKDIYLLESAVRFEHFRPWLLFLSVFVAIIGLIALKSSQATSSEKALIVTGLFMLLMSFSVTRFLWEFLPGLSVVQFPWRTIFPGSAMVFVGANSYLRNFYQEQKVMSTCVILIPWILLIAIFTLPGKSWPPELLEESCYKKTFYLPFLPVTVPVSSKLSEWAGEPHKWKTVSGKKIFGPTYKGHGWADYGFKNVQEGQKLNILSHFDPYWRVKIVFADSHADRKELSLIPQPSKDDGTMIVDLPSGDFILSLYRVRPAWRLLGYIMAILATGVWFLSLKKALSAV